LRYSSKAGLRSMKYPCGLKIKLTNYEINALP
jgi:hypothetical protein